MNNTIPFPGAQEPQGERLPPIPMEEPKEKIVLDQRGLIDVPFLLLTVLLVAIGVIMMFSASYASAYLKEDSGTFYFSRQAMFALAGIAVMLLASRVDYHVYRIFAYWIFLGTMVLMFMVPIFGTEENGAKRWIWIGFTSLQPSEIAKLAIIIVYARLLSEYKERVRNIRNLAPFIGVLGVVLLSLILQRHLSAIVIVCGVAGALMFMGGMQLRWFLAAGGVLGVGGLIYLNVMDYAASRLTAWRDPWADAADSGYQIIQSLLAIGSGGLTGLGLGRSRQKYLYLPEEHNDYIFPIVCEELGFVGAVVIILLFVLLIIRGYWIAAHAKDRFGALLAAGITTLLALQVFLNIGVVTNFLPATGISLPFFSYGVTALLMHLGEMGIILSVSRQCENQLLA